MGTAEKKRGVDTHKTEKRKVGQNAEVMPRPLNLSIAIYSLEVRTLFSFCFKETHACFDVDYFCSSYRVEICTCLCVYPGIQNMQPFIVL